MRCCIRVYGHVLSRASCYFFFSFFLLSSVFFSPSHTSSPAPCTLPFINPFLFSTLLSRSVEHPLPFLPYRFSIWFSPRLSFPSLRLRLPLRSPALPPLRAQLSFPDSFSPALYTIPGRSFFPARLKLSRAPLFFAVETPFFSCHLPLPYSFDVRNAPFSPPSFNIYRSSSFFFPLVFYFRKFVRAFFSGLRYPGFSFFFFFFIDHFFYLHPHFLSLLFVLRF